MITGAETAHLAPRPTPIFLEGKLPVVEATTARALGLRDGQVVQGTIEVRFDALRLNLMGQAIELPRDLPPGLRLAAGDQLLFRVQLLPNGTLVLRPLQADGTGATTSTAPTAAASAPLSALADRLQQLSLRPPDMGSLSQLLQPGALSGLLQSLGQLGSGLPPELAQALQQWLRQRPAMGQLTPEKLQQFMAHSGWMTEHLLGKGAGAADLKTALRALLRHLQAQGSESASVVRNAIDDIESRQLQSVESLSGREFVFSMVLPFRDAEPVHMRLTRGRRPREQGPPPWVIHLHTRSQLLGEVWLQSRITDMTEVDLVMWALREDVVQQAQARTPLLADELESAGLHMTRLMVVHGPGPTEPMEWSPPEAGSLVDVQT